MNNSKFKSRKNIFFLSVIAILLSFPTITYSQDDFEIDKNLDIYYQVFKQLKLYYVDDIQSGEMTKTAIDAMLKSLDPYTNYIPESEIEDYRFLTTGVYGGVGALIHKRDGKVVISEPYEGFPAHKAGLKAGDVILKIDGKSIEGKTSDNVSTFLKGQSGTEIKLLIKREGLNDHLEVKLKREDIKIKNIPYTGLVHGDVAYIKLTGFTRNAGKEVKDALIKLKDSIDLKGVIIDLRDNGGGLLNEAVYIVNLFVDKGKEVVSTKGRIVEKNHMYKTMQSAVDTNIPLTILVNDMSASASEIVAGAIQDYDRGVIIGQKSYGKGLVQNVVPLSYNAKMKVTVSKYYIPSGRCIQAIDYSKKDVNGKAIKANDSLATAFKTKNGRTVYDMGGIKPDVIMPEKEYGRITTSLTEKFLIFDFATKYAAKYRGIKEPKDFDITDNIYKEFEQFLVEKKFEYTAKSEKTLENLKEIAIKEKYFNAISEEYEKLKKELAAHKTDDIQKFKEEIKLLIKLEIVNRYYFQSGEAEASIKGDKEIIKAVKIINDKNQYESILKG